MAKVALVTGANGITGSNIIQHLVKNTTPDQWSKIVITTKSPLSYEIPDPRVEFVALDFFSDPKHITEQMKEKCHDVTHAFFSSYVHRDDFEELNKVNQQIFENFVTCLTSVAMDLQNITLQTGGKYYAVHLSPGPFPCLEDGPRPDMPIGNFYYPQEDFLSEKQKGQKWRWNVIRPVAIIGTCPKPNGMNIGLTIAMYVQTCIKLGQDPKLPTNELFWDCVEDMSYAPLVADITVWASTTPEAANQAFNLSNGDYMCWRYMWPRIVDYFGAQTSTTYEFKNPRPKAGELQQEFEMHDWAQRPETKKAWEELCDESGCPEAKASWEGGCWRVMDWVLSRTWAMPLSMNKARKFGYPGFIDTYDCFSNAFDKYKELKQIPS